MRVMLEIQDSHIREAESFLIEGKRFDEEERIPFIKNLETLDLFAVPGSGKTTALQAKLYCLAKQMPFADNSGILVLSHTNKAVEEIEKQLKSQCPQLFAYPNFVGTIQAFMNKFLANYALFAFKGSYIKANCDDLYAREMRQFYHSLPWKKFDSKTPYLKNDLYFRANSRTNDKTTDKKNQNAINFLLSLRLNSEHTKIIYGEKDTILYTESGAAQHKFHEIKNQKYELYSQGILSFSDSYYFARRQITSYPSIVKLLQKRFKYIFIDEAQDLLRNQLDIIDEVFYTESSYKTIIQRVGDINQAIYNSQKAVGSSCEWIPRETCLYLNKSHRLSQPIANVVDYFTLNKGCDSKGIPKFKVQGNASAINIPPHLIIFDRESMGGLKKEFQRLIMKYNLLDDPKNERKGFKIIGWSCARDEKISSEKLRLVDIFPTYKKNSHQRAKIAPTSLLDTVAYNPQEQTLFVYQKSIILAFCTILNLSEISYEIKSKTDTRRVLFNVKYFWESLKEKVSEDALMGFKQQLFSWSFQLATNSNIENVYEQLKQFIKDDLTTIYDFTLQGEALTFICQPYKKIITSPTNTADSPLEQAQIDICSVHSVKGQTHCATMYVETSYHTYETKKKCVIDALRRNHHKLDILNDKDVRAKEAFKMMYVGFSRPTHLLCFAVLRENVEAHIKELREKGWEISDITSHNQLHF